MSWLSARRREIEALRHYRPSQIALRAASRLRRRMVAAAPGPLRRRLAVLEQAPPPPRPLSCPEALRAHALDPVVVSPVTAEDLLAGRFVFLGAARDFGARILWRERGRGGPSHLWRMHLHYHRFTVEASVGALRDPGRAPVLLDRAADLLLDWSRACPPGEHAGFEDAWNGYAVSTRLLHGFTARRLLEGFPGDPAERLRAILDGRAAADAAFLSRWLEHDLGGNHLLRNAMALVAAGRWFSGPSGDAWLRAGDTLLARQIERQVLADGLHEERSPMYHALLLEDLLCLGPRLEHEKESAARLLGALATVTHPDGEIALFNDSAFGVASPPDRLARLARGLGVRDAPAGAGDLPQAGYFRLGAADDCAIFDAGPLGPDHLPAHAHCDALSFELSLAGRRVVTDTGVDRYEAGPERDFQRSTAAHTTLQVDGLEQGEPFGSFRMGRRPRVLGRRLDPHRVEGEHDGFGRAGVHRRSARWEGRALSWTDVIDGEVEVPVTVRVGLAPGVEAALVEGGASVRVPRGERLRWSTPTGALAIESGIYCPGFGRREPRAVLCWRGAAGRGRALPFALVPDGL